MCVLLASSWRFFSVSLSISKQFILIPIVVWSGVRYTYLAVWLVLVFGTHSVLLYCHCYPYVWKKNNQTDLRLCHALTLVLCSHFFLSVQLMVLNSQRTSTVVRVRARDQTIYLLNTYTHSNQESQCVMRRLANIFKIHEKKWKNRRRRKKQQQRRRLRRRRQNQQQHQYNFMVCVLYTHLQSSYGDGKTEHTMLYVLTAESNETKQKKICSKYSEWKIV